MIQRNGSVTDEYSRPVPGATVYVYNQDGTDATLTLDGTTPVVEPITTDEWGAYSYFAAEGLYREDIWFGGKRRAVDYNVAIGDPGLVFKGDPGSPGEGYATRAAMQAAATTPTDGDDFYETETGGKWVYRAGNYAARAAVDTTGGVIRQAGAIALSTGALVRQSSGGKASASHFGALQSAVDYSMYGGTSLANVGLNAFIDQQTVNLTDTLHIGYGTAYKGVIVEGLGINYDGSGGNSGTAIFTTVTDRPAINIQGARRSRLTGFILRHSAIYNAYLAMDVTVSSSLAEATWDAVLTGAGVTAGQRYAPHAGIAVDGYSGVQPSPHYPDITYPSFLGAVSQYGKNKSSGVRIHTDIQGFEVGVAIQPSNVDSNGDFIDLTDCSIKYCKYAVSIGNSQGRNIDLGGLNVANVYSVITNDKHGLQHGKVGATIKNLNVASFCYQLFEFGRMAFAGPLEFTGTLAESIFKIGTFTSSSSTSGALTFSNYSFNFNIFSDEALPASLIAGDGNDLVTFGRGTFKPRSVASLTGTAKVKLDGAYIEKIDAPAKAYEALCSNALMGGFATDPVENMPQQALMRVYNASTLGITDVRLCDASFSTTGRDNCIPHALQAGRCSTLGNWVSKPMTLGVVSAASMTSVSRSDRAITFTLTSGQMGSADAAYGNGQMPGCVAIHYETGTVAFIRSTDTTTRVIIAEMQNNYVKSGSAYNIFDTAFDPAVGTWYFVNGLVYSPARMLWGDLEVGSSNIINVQSAGNSFDANLGLTTGDMLAGAHHFDQPFTGSNSLTISTLAVPAAITMSGVTQANPGVVTTSAAHGLITGEIVAIASVVGMTQLNNNKYKVRVLTTTTFSLQDAEGNAVDTTGFTAYTSGGTATPIGGRITLAGKANFTARHYALPFWYRAAPTNSASR